MKASKTRFSNKKLVVLLCVFSVIIVGLLVGVMIVVTKNLSGNNGDDQEYGNDYNRVLLENDCMSSDEYDETMICIESDYLATGDLDNAIGRYDRVIENKISEHNWGLAANLIVAESNFYYLVTGDCDLAFEKIKQWDLADFTVEVKAGMYSAFIILSNECENYEENEYWNNMYNAVMGNNYRSLDEE